LHVRVRSLRYRERVNGRFRCRIKPAQGSRLPSSRFTNCRVWHGTSSRRISEENWHGTPRPAPGQRSQRGHASCVGPKFPKIGYLETLEALKNHAHYNAPLGKFQGRGMASGYWFNAGGESSATLNVNGIRMTALPMSPPRVLAALDDAQLDEAPD
jgi:hypothetical protein